MASPQGFSTNTGLGVLPEIDRSKDLALYNELARIRSAIRSLASTLDYYTGATTSGLDAFSAGNIAFGSGRSWTGDAGFTYSVDTGAVQVTNVRPGVAGTSLNLQNTLGSTAITVNIDGTDQLLLGFFGTATLQPTPAVTEAAFAQHASANTLYKESTYDGYTVGQVVKALKLLGLLA